MSGYMLGLVTVPLVLAATIALWLLLKFVVASLTIVSRTISRESTNGQRNTLAAIVGGSARSWHIGGGDNVLIFARGLDHAKADEARRLLDHDGPWATYAKLPEAIPALKPRRRRPSDDAATPAPNGDR